MQVKCSICGETQGNIYIVKEYESGILHGPWCSWCFNEYEYELDKRTGWAGYSLIKPPDEEFYTLYKGLQNVNAN